MAQFSIDIPDELLPALAAEFVLVQGSTPATTPQEYFTASVVETVRQRAEMYKVGPYYVGPVDPQFNADGTVFGAPPVSIIEEPVHDLAMLEPGAVITSEGDV
jgi:hypothetical protein